MGYIESQMDRYWVCPICKRMVSCPTPSEWIPNTICGPHNEGYVVMVELSAFKRKKEPPH